jgi:hypothetical protein
VSGTSAPETLAKGANGNFFAAVDSKQLLSSILLDNTRAGLLASASLPLPTSLVSNATSFVSNVIFSPIYYYFY